MAGAKGKSGTSPNSIKNLEPAAKHMTHEELVEAGRKGGIASGEAKRERKEMKELINDILNTPMKKGKAEEGISSLAEAKNKNLTIDQMIILAQVKEALNGNTRAFCALLDYAGMKPTDKKEVTATIEASPLTSILEQLANDEEE